MSLLNRVQEQEIADLRRQLAEAQQARERAEYIIGAIRCVVNKQGTDDSVLEAVQELRRERDAANELLQK